MEEGIASEGHIQRERLIRSVIWHTCGPVRRLTLMSGARRLGSEGSALTGVI